MIPTFQPGTIQAKLELLAASISGKEILGYSQACSHIEGHPTVFLGSAMRGRAGSWILSMFCMRMNYRWIKDTDWISTVNVRLSRFYASSLQAKVAPHASPMTICWKSVTVAAKMPLNPAEQFRPADGFLLNMWKSLVLAKEQSYIANPGHCCLRSITRTCVSSTTYPYRSAFWRPRALLGRTHQ